MNGRRDPKLILFAVLAVGMLVAGVGALAYRSLTAPPVVQVSIVDYRFQPANVTIKAGTTVRWINMDFVGHTVSFGMHGNETGVESDLMGHMGTFGYTFIGPGTYPYHCDPHPYMTGVVVVIL